MRNSVVKVTGRRPSKRSRGRQSVAAGCHGTTDGSWELSGSGIITHGKYRGMKAGDAPDDYIRYMAEQGVEWAVTEWVRRSQ